MASITNNIPFAPNQPGARICASPDCNIKFLPTGVFRVCPTCADQDLPSLLPAKIRSFLPTPPESEFNIDYTEELSRPSTRSSSSTPTIAPSAQILLEDQFFAPHIASQQEIQERIRAAEYWRLFHEHENFRAEIGRRELERRDLKAEIQRLKGCAERLRRLEMRAREVEVVVGEELAGKVKVFLEVDGEREGEEERWMEYGLGMNGMGGAESLCTESDYQGSVTSSENVPEEGDSDSDWQDPAGGEVGEVDEEVEESVGGCRLEQDSEGSVESAKVEAKVAPQRESRHLRAEEREMKVKVKVKQSQAETEEGDSGSEFVQSHSDSEGTVTDGRTAEREEATVPVIEVKIAKQKEKKTEGTEVKVIELENEPEVAVEVVEGEVKKKKRNLTPRCGGKGRMLTIRSRSQKPMNRFM